MQLHRETRWKIILPYSNIMLMEVYLVGLVISIRILVDSDAAQLLNTEHTVELHKIAMQTIGRTERRDAQMNGIIRLPSGVHHNALCFSRFGSSSKCTIVTCFPESA